MIIDKVSGDRTKLTLALNKHLKSLARPNINITCVGHTPTTGSIAITAAGKRGIVQKYFSVYYNSNTEEWEVYGDGYCYKMLVLSEIGLIIKTNIQKMRTLLGRI